MRPSPTTLCLLVLLTAAVTPVGAQAQRDGLVIDLGAGPGLVSANYTTVGLGESSRETRVGFSVDFNIGLAIRPDLDVHLATQSTFRSTERQGTDRAMSGVAGVGATYHLDEAFGVIGAIGAGFEFLYMDGFFGTPFDTSFGPGGFAGVRYRVAEHFAVNVDVAFAAWDDGEIFGSEEVRSWSLGATLVYLVP